MGIVDDIKDLGELENAIAKKVSDNITTYLAAELANIYDTLSKKVDTRLTEIDAKYEKRFQQYEMEQAVLKSSFWPKWLMKWLIASPAILVGVYLAYNLICRFILVIHQ